MITTKRINEDLRDVEGLEWISALRSDGIRSLVDAGKIDRSLLDEKDLATLTRNSICFESRVQSAFHSCVARHCFFLTAFDGFSLKNTDSRCGILRRWRFKFGLMILALVSAAESNTPSPYH